MRGVASTEGQEPLKTTTATIHLTCDRLQRHVGGTITRNKAQKGRPLPLGPVCITRLSFRHQLVYRIYSSLPEIYDTMVHILHISEHLFSSFFFLLNVVNFYLQQLVRKGYRWQGGG